MASFDWAIPMGESLAAHRFRGHSEVPLPWSAAGRDHSTPDASAAFSSPREPALVLRVAGSAHRWTLRVFAIVPSLLPAPDGVALPGAMRLRPRFARPGAAATF